MNSRYKQLPSGRWDEDTVLRPAGEQAKVCCHKREALAGSGPHLTKETQALLRLRLRASAFMLFIGFAVFLVRHIVGLLTSEALSVPLLVFHVLVVLVLGLCAAPLYRHRVVSVRTLRIAELIIFGLPAAFFVMLQHRLILEDAVHGFLSPPMPFWLLLIFTYGMFIPNTWRRAAFVIGPMALAPVLLVCVMILTYPQVAEVTTIAAFMQYVLVMLVATTASVVGSHLITALRREAFEARQLGQYRLIQPLGSGGMGEVYLAEHRMLKRPCAVKLIHPDQAGDPQVLARFEREVRMTARLSHWNTVEIFDYGRTDDGTFFYVMEYLPGLSLQDLLDRHGPMPAERVIHLLRQACQGLREAHAIGLIHRDIKPGNVFVAQRGGLYDVVKVLDFGLVKPVTESPSARLTQEGSISGTPLYMSPEQARGQDSLDARSDIYSLGAVAYALLTGQPPFGGASSMEVLIAQVRDEATPPSKHQADVPADLERVILRCLAKNPAERFPDVDSLEQALSECAAAEHWTQSQATRWWRDKDRLSVSANASTPLEPALMLETE